MADAGDLIVLSSITAVINCAYRAKNGRPVGQPLLAAGVGFVGLSVLGGIWRWDFAVAIAGLFMFAAIVMRGLPLIEDLGSLATTQAKAAGTGGGGGGSF